MKKLLGYLMLTMAGGIFAIAFGVFYQSVQLENLMSKESKLAGRLNDQARKVSDTARKLQSTASSFFSTNTTSELEATNNELQTILHEFEVQTQELMHKDFSDYHSSKLMILGKEETFKDATAKLFEEQKNLTGGFTAVLIARYQQLDSVTGEIKLRQSILNQMKNFVKTGQSNTFLELSPSVNGILNNAGEELKSSQEEFEKIAQRTLKNSRSEDKDFKKAVLELAQTRSQNGHFTELKTFEKLLEINSQRVDSILDFAATKYGKTQLSAIETLASIRNFTFLLAILVLLASTSLGLFISNKLVKTLSSTSQSLAKAGHDFVELSSDLKSVSQQLAQGAQKSSKAIDQSVKALKESVNSTQITADRARKSSEMAEQSVQMANQGLQEVRNLAAFAKEISVASETIASLVIVIEDIAFQTNLLALNAAVEAARAGEQGKGFSVVAEAVRGLAQKSSQEAKKINSVVLTTVESTKMGAQLADQGEAALVRILQSAIEVKNLNDEIMNSSSSQNQNLSDVQRSIKDVEKIAKENSDSSQLTEISAQNLNEQAETLSELVQELEYLINEDKKNQSPHHSYDMDSDQFEIKKVS